MRLRYALLAVALGALSFACGAQSITADNLCPDPPSYCEGTTLVRCSTDTSGVIPEPRLTRTDCAASNRVCIPEPDGASCR
jgi:hypothetical protein